MRKVCVCTGTRAEYGILKPLMLEIRKSGKLELQTVVSGMHLLERFGNSFREIEEDGFKIDAKLPIFVDKDSGKAMAESIANGIKAFADAFQNLKPDFVLVLGDRLEAFAATLAASCMNIAVGHLHAGDRTASGWDEAFRYSISRFASIQFAATRKSAERLLESGEQKQRIHVVGAPGLDSILAEKIPSRKEVCEKLGLEWQKPVVLVVQHSVTTEPENAAGQMKETMEAVKQLADQAVVIYPNSDAGGRAMIEVIEQYRELPFIKIFKNLDHKMFLGLMKCAAVMVGNSSGGIIEASSFGLPAVNIGSRQLGRERAANVVDAEHDRVDIRKKIEKALFDKAFIAKAKKCKSPYGDGKASKRIVKILETVETGPRLLQKQVGA